MNALQHRGDVHKAALVVATALTLAVYLVVIAPPAAATPAPGTVGVFAGTLTYTARAGEANDATVVRGGAGNYLVSDDTPITPAPGAGCSQFGAITVSCPASGVSAIQMDLGDLNDFADTRLVNTRSTLLGGAGDDGLFSGSGNDTLRGGPGTDNMQGGAGLDTVSYSDRQEPVEVTIGADSGELGEGDFVGSDVDIVIGGSGNDTLTGNDGSLLGDDLLIGGSGNDTLIGLGGADSVFGGDGNDLLRGGNGEDTLLGGPGADNMGGGAGVDDVTYVERQNPVAVTIGSPDFSGETGEGDTVAADVETLIGGSGDDTLTGADDAVNVLRGGDGSDTLSGLGGGDTLTGGAGNDVLRGGNDEDNLVGGPGADNMGGGAGTDTASYRERTNSVTVAVGIADASGELGEFDTVAADVEVVLGGEGSDTLVGGNGSSGVEGRDVLNGLGGDDTLRGLGGDDTLIGGPGADNMGGGAGADIASYVDRVNPVTVTIGAAGAAGERGESDTVAADVEWIFGGRGSDTLTGDNGSDLLAGGPGDDILSGLGGDDVLIEGAGGGQDRLRSGAGNDRLLARDSAADLEINCGDGPADLAQVDPADPPTFGCEVLQ